MYTTLLKTNQTKPILGREDEMVKNNAGGFVFKIEDIEQFKKFLIIGSENGTYYVGKQDLTLQNTQNTLKLIKSNPEAVLGILVEYMDNNKLLKINTGLFVLALIATYADSETKHQSYKQIYKLCKTATHLFTFVKYVTDLRGWSSGLRKGVAQWYLRKTPEQLIYQITKYKCREGFTHRDVLRLCHAKTYDCKLDIDKQKLNDVFRYIVGKEKALHISEKLHIIESINKECTNDESLSKVMTEWVAKSISRFDLQWENIPTAHLNNPDILTALLPSMGIIALIRNLNRFSNADLLSSELDPVAMEIFNRLRTNEKINDIHPVNLLNYMKTYASGHGVLGNLSWRVNSKVVKILEDRFNQSMMKTTVTQKNILVAQDVSGSMSAQINNSSLKAYEASTAIALSYYKNNPNCDLICFDTECKDCKIKNLSYAEAVNYMHCGGGTDCSKPLDYALNKMSKGVKIDACVILTDNETWSGDRHAVNVLKEIRKINPKFKVIVLGTTATEYSIVDNDPRNLSICGFDDSVIKLINDFIDKE